MFFLVAEFRDLSSFLGGGGRGHRDQPAAWRGGGEGCGGEGRGGPGLSPTVCLPLRLTFRKPSAPGWLGPLGGAGLPAGRAVPTSSRLGPEQHKGEDCSHEVPGPENTSGRCVCSRGCGLRRSSLLARSGGLGARASPSFPGPQPCLSRWERRTSEGTDSTCSLCLSPPTDALPAGTTLSFPTPTQSPRCPHIRPQRPWASLPDPVQRGKLRPREDKAVRNMGFEATPLEFSSQPCVTSGK